MPGTMPTRPVWTTAPAVPPRLAPARTCQAARRRTCRSRRVAQETSYSAVGNVIHYTIVATNDGNTTLAAVTVTDPKVSGLVCTPANGSSLAPGASMSCTASHTVTQADIDAGHYANTACVDDGAGGAAQACAGKDVPGTQNPHLSITKNATPAGYSTVGQVINYTIVAKNDGNTTLAAVTVTDPKVSSLVCTPANGSSLAPGASMSCTASHTVTQADIDAGHYANTACVDDGAAGAAQACASKDVPVQRSTAQIAPTNTTCQMFRDGTAGNLTTLQYGVKSNKINNVAPGVMFYYSKITAPAATFTIQVPQSNTKGWKPVAIQDVGQVILWNANCVKSTASATYNSTTGAVTINVTRATAGAVYYLSIKYNNSSLTGQSVSKPYPTATYSFKTVLNGVEISTSVDSVNVAPK